MGRVLVLLGVIGIITLGLIGINAAQTKVRTEENVPTVDLEPKHPNHDKVHFIYFNRTDKATVKIWIDRLEEVLKEYERNDNLENIESCVPHKRPKEGKVCRFRVDTGFGPCSKENMYGYYKNTPCIFISLSKIDKWIPEYYNVSTIPEDMPSDLKMRIEENQKLNKHKKIWVSCKGEKPFDVENIGPIDYYPDRGFSSEFFPYERIGGYMSPFVAVHIVRPLKAGVVMNIECKVWAHNIEIDSENQKGFVRFEVLMDW